MTSRRDGVPMHLARELLADALERPAQERRDFVRSAAGADAALVEEVLSLLASLEDPHSLPEPPPVARAGGGLLEGRIVGHLRLGRRIGEGGMGVVHEAEDERLGRRVAVKALPAGRDTDPVRAERLALEARTLAALNHPAIATIHGVEHLDGRHLLVMEYVPGEDLAALIRRGPLPLEDAIAIGRQIARGLEAAHAAGLVHRDLKPSNVRVTPDGSVKILDFGVASRHARAGAGTDEASTGRGHDAVPGDAPAAPRIGAEGTPAYMSPEQARGRPSDPRSDLWALGCVLYEMLTGRQAFEGRSASATIAAVLRGEPQWDALPPLPPALERLLRRCLRRDPDQRLRSAGDAVLELDDAAAELHGQGAPRRGARRSPAGVAAVAMAAFALGLMVARMMAVPPEATAPIRSALQVPERLPLEWDVGASFAVSPDGTQVAYTGYVASDTQELHLLHLEDGTVTRLPVGGPVRTPCFSPDGAWIGVSSVRTGSLVRVNAATGAHETLATVPHSSAGLAWVAGSADGGRVPEGIVCAEGTFLTLTPLDGRAARTVASADGSVGETGFSQPCALPGGRALVATLNRRSNGSERHCVVAVDLDTGRRTPLIENAWDAHWLAPGFLVWSEASWVVAAPFDPRSLRLGDGRTRLAGPLPGGHEPSPVARCATGGTTLVHLPAGVGGAATDLAWVDAAGRLSTALAGDRPISTIRTSPDGLRAALSVGPDPNVIRVCDLGRGTAWQVSPGDGRSRDYPVWSADGRQLIVSSSGPDGSRLERLAAEGNATPQVLASFTAGADGGVVDVVPGGGAFLVCIRGMREAGAAPESGRGRDADRDLGTLPADGGGVTPLFPLAARRWAARFSPDGRWLACTEGPWNEEQVVLYDWPSLTTRTIISGPGGVRPAWRNDSRAIYYRARDQILEVRLQSTDPLVLEPARVLASGLPEMRYDAGCRDGRLLTPLPRASPERSPSAGTTFAVLFRADVAAGRTAPAPLDAPARSGDNRRMSTPRRRTPSRTRTRFAPLAAPLLLLAAAGCSATPAGGGDAGGSRGANAAPGADAAPGAAGGGASAGGARMGFEEARAMFQSRGVQPGEPLPPLSVVTLQGAPVTVEQFRRGRPMVLATCSLTCNVARRNQAFADDLRIRAGTDAMVLMLYTIDAHPAGDPCPYTGHPWVPKDNERDDVLVRQPATLEERLALARTYQERFGPSALVVVDTMDNAAWEALGKAPNVALLVDSEGIVRLRQGWFEPAAMETALREECREERRQKALERTQAEESEPDSR